MRVGIVGAGICGLAAGRTLKQLGHDAVLFEKSRGPGGRTATRRRNGFVWDTGATSIAPRGKTIESVILKEIDTTGLVEIPFPVWVHEGLRVMPGHPARSSRRFVYRDGINTLPKRLAIGLEIRTEATIEGLERLGAGFRLAGEDFDALILTPPVPQTSVLLWSLGESRALATARYRPCISVMLGFQTPLPDVAYFALIAEGHPLTWLSLESVKSPGRAPDGGSALVAQLSPSFSLANYDRPDEWLVDAVVSYLERLYGPNFATPVASDVMRWKYSQPESLSTFEDVNPPGERLLVASDALLGGHIEDAYEVGVRVAHQIHALP